MFSDNEKTAVFLGYAIITLQELKYQENNIEDFLKKFKHIIKAKNEQEAFNIFNKFTDDSTKQIIFEGILIPVEYNMERIRDIFINNGFTGKEYNFTVNRTFNALYRKDIIYIKDLYGKTKKDIIRIESLGENSYRFFIQALQKIFHYNPKAGSK